MKLKKYEDKSKKRRKTILISISVIVLISVSLLLYKTFASFTESAEFPMMKGKVDYFGNSDIYFAFYKGDEQLDTMPVKDNPDNLVFDHGECDNGASIEWNNNEWAPLVKGLKKVKTKCSLYFKEQTGFQLNRDIPIVETGDGLYKVDHSVTEIDSGWNKIEYRYAGEDPNNYIAFNDEIWRIIGLVNVQTDSGIEQRVKLTRISNVFWTDENEDFHFMDDLGYYSWDYKSTYNNDWTTSTLKDMLNGIYYNSEIGDCYQDVNNPIPTECDFTQDNINSKGLNEEARLMIDKDVIWNLGEPNDIYNAPTMYEKERSVSVKESGYPSVWTRENDSKYHNGVGLIYPSDYGYAVANDRETCLEKKLLDFDSTCYTIENINWLYTDSHWFLTTHFDNSNKTAISSTMSGIYWGDVNQEANILPTVYLNNKVYIESDESDNYGSIDNPFRLTF